MSDKYEPFTDDQLKIISRKAQDFMVETEYLIAAIRKLQAENNDLKYGGPGRTGNTGITGGQGSAPKVKIEPQVRAAVSRVFDKPQKGK